LFVKVPVIVELTDRADFICDPKSSYGSLVFYEGLPEYYEMNFLKKKLNTKSIFIDVGANVGVYSLLAASVIKSGKIFAFEVNPQALDVFFIGMLI